MKKLWKFEWTGGYSLIGGIFKATDEEVESIIGKHLYLGEVDGKHSDVYGTIERNEITLISDNPIVVEAVPTFGYDPVEYIKEQEDDEI